MKIKWPAKQTFVEAVYYGYEYVLLDEKHEPLHAAVQCKDFLQDAFWSEHVKQPASIYGFNWTPGTLNPTAARYRIAVRYNAKPFEDYATASLAFLHKFEKSLEFKHTTLVMDTTGTIGVFTFDHAWTTEPVLLSAFLLFLRIGASFPGGSASAFVEGFGDVKALAACDTEYVARARHRIKEMLGGRSSFSQTWKQYKPSDINTLHNRSGIVYYREKK